MNNMIHQGMMMMAPPHVQLPAPPVRGLPFHEFVPYGGEFDGDFEIAGEIYAEGPRRRRGDRRYRRFLRQLDRDGMQLVPRQQVIGGNGWGRDPREGYGGDEGFFMQFVAYIVPARVRRDGRPPWL